MQPPQLFIKDFSYFHNNFFLKTLFHFYIFTTGHTLHLKLLQTLTIFSMLYNKYILVACLIADGLYPHFSTPIMSLPASPHTGNQQFVLCISETAYLLLYLLVVFFRFYTEMISHSICLSLTDFTPQSIPVAAKWQNILLFMAEQ